MRPRKFGSDSILILKMLLSFLPIVVYGYVLKITSRLEIHVKIFTDEIIRCLKFTLDNPVVGRSDEWDYR